MSVQAKFRVTAISANSVNDGSVTLQAVTGDSPENKEFFKYTPSGELKMGIVNTKAYEQFKENLGKEVYLTFDFVE